MEEGRGMVGRRGEKEGMYERREVGREGVME